MSLLLWGEVDSICPFIPGKGTLAYYVPYVPLWWRYICVLCPLCPAMVKLYWSIITSYICSYFMDKKKIRKICLFSSNFQPIHVSPQQWVHCEYLWSIQEELNRMQKRTMNQLNQIKHIDHDKCRTRPEDMLLSPEVSVKEWIQGLTRKENRNVNWCSK